MLVSISINWSSWHVKTHHIRKHDIDSVCRDYSVACAGQGTPKTYSSPGLNEPCIIYPYKNEFRYKMVPQSACSGNSPMMLHSPFPEPVYTGWSSVHWNATGMPLVDPVYPGIPLGDPVNICRVHWNTTGKTQLKLPHTGMTLENL